jgi:hypothetical protein
MVSWHMRHYGSLTPKPHYAFANSKAIGGLWKGKLKGWKKRSKEDGHIATCETYKNKVGKKCWKGTKKLRATEILECNSDTIFLTIPAPSVLEHSPIHSGKYIYNPYI